MDSTSENEESMDKSYMDVEDLDVYQKLCKLHIEVCDLSHEWPAEEKYELGSQVRRSSNSAPAQLAEKHSDRHIKNKIEGVNRSRGEAAETIHHLYMATLKAYITEKIFRSYKARYKECIRMLNGMEKSLEKHLPNSNRRLSSPDFRLSPLSCCFPNVHTNLYRPNRRIRLCGDAT
jgi:four helix bundle protein